MARSLADNAIALLIELAERGDIDPWDVKVIEVIDRFLSKLQPEPSTEAGRAPYESDLSESGQAFLYASVLLLLKADSLARQEADKEAELEEVELLDAEFVNAPLPPHLEKRIRRRAVAPAAPNRRVTLPELIAQLNLISTAMTDQKPRRVALRRPRPQSQRQAIRAIAQLAHQENLSEVAAALEQFLAQYWDAQNQGHDWLHFEALLQLWADAQPPENGKGTPGEAVVAEAVVAKMPVNAPELPQASATPNVHDRVGVFWALLFLSAQSKVELLQEEFYQDLRVRSLVELPDAGNLTSDSFAVLE